MRPSLEVLAQPTIDPPRARMCVKPFVSPIFTTLSPGSSLPSSLDSMLALEKTDAPPATAYSTVSSLSEPLNKPDTGFADDPFEHPKPAVNDIATTKSARNFELKGIACSLSPGYLTNP